jgi:hypothetical protein
MHDSNLITNNNSRSIIKKEDDILEVSQPKHTIKLCKNKTKADENAYQ